MTVVQNSPHAQVHNGVDPFEARRLMAWLADVERRSPAQGLGIADQTELLELVSQLRAELEAAQHERSKVKKLFGQVRHVLALGGASLASSGLDEAGKALFHTMFS